MAISIVTKLPIFEVFKPLLFYLLHELYNPNFDFSMIDKVFQNLNKSHLDSLLNHFSHLNPASRFVLTRIQPDFSMNDSLKLPSEFSDKFTDAGNLYKTFINLGAPKLNFPIQIPKSSIIASPLAMFGIDLQRDSSIKRLLKRLDTIHISLSESSPKENCLTPYANIKPLHVLINALISKKKVVLYAHNTCYNILTDFAETLYLIYNSGCYQNEEIPFHPIVDLSSIELVRHNDNYLIGTSSPLLLENLDWNVFLNFDSETLHVRIENDMIDHKYFSTNSDSDSENDNPFDIDKRTSLNSNYTSYSMNTSTSCVSTMSSIDSFHADSRLSYWDPSCFPRLNANDEKAESFLHPNGLANETSFPDTKFPYSANFSSIPRIDKALDAQITRLVKNHHDDETLFVLLTNYLRNLTTRVLPAFYHFSTFLQLRDYRAHLLVNSHLVKRTSSNSNEDFDVNLDSSIRQFIQSKRLIQPFPLNFPFDSLHAFLDDPKISSHYARIVLANVPLLRLSVHYNDLMFKSVETVPGFVFTWSGGEDNPADDEIDIRLDTHYLVGILDRMIDGTSNESWQLNKYLLLQIFKALNAILKAHGTGVNGLNDVLVDLFIEKRGDESFAKACGIKLSDFKSTISSNTRSSESSMSSNGNLDHKSDNQVLEKLRRLAVSATNIEFVKEAIRGGNGMELDDNISLTTSKRKLKDISSATSKVIRDSKKTRSDLLTEHCEDDELLSHVGTLGTQRFTKLILVAALYLSIRGPEDIVETKKGIRRKDLLLTEFKRFLSGVLNDQFFKEFVLVEMDDFVKLTVNDFIDYHM
ncbi:hypothetical protein PMKS-003630 [Pichia membranifaciens]|uniref:UDENN domain-containing protein n=1 Tax=Pichia membranifaciens TaxID=4926 RepID=A0A1Q2YL90_9ASCO|nr:hypothetical protein PMKS-003630 [Pichia membranifaciens]